MSHIEYATERGMVPVVNMRDFPSIYSKEGTNVWEEYFEQPAGYTLDDVYGSQHVTFSYNIPHIQGHELWSVAGMEGTERFENLKKLYSKYIRFSKEIMSYVEEGCRQTLGNHRNIVSCICRGTDYNNTLVGIAKQPTAGMVIDKVKELMQESGCKYIYCATEDKRIYEKFQKEFGTALLPNIQQKYGDNEGKLLAKVNVEHNIDVYRIAREYVRSIYIVSRCRSFVGGQVSATTAVMLMPNEFERTYIFRLGQVTPEDIINAKKNDETESKENTARHEDAMV